MTPAIALATFILLAVAFFGLFAGSARKLDSSTKRDIRQWITRSSRGQVGDQAWAEGFVRWFDHAFKVRVRRIPGLGEVGMPSFWRSVLVSFLSLFVLAIVWLFNKPGFNRAMEHGDPTLGTWEMAGRLLVVYGGATLITNWIPDYLSLIESRYIMGKMARARSWPRRLAWLGVDAVATLVISFLAIHIGMVVMLPLVTPEWGIEVGCLTPDTYSLATTWELFISGLRFDGPAGTLNYDATGIYIYSTFITSLWVWVYLGGSFLLRAVVALRSDRAAVLRRRPLHAMGVMVLLVFSLAFWPSWLHRRAHTADVYIHHVQEDATAARALADELEHGGLRVRASFDSDAALRRELLASADAVIVLDSPASRSNGELDRSRHELYLQGECGERAWGLTARVQLDGVGWHTGYTEHPTDIGRYGSWMDWRPGEPADAIVTWAQQADSLLASGQVLACQQREPWTEYGYGDPACASRAE